MLTHCCGCTLRTPTDPTVARYAVTFGNLVGTINGYNLTPVPVLAASFERQNWSVSALPSYYTAAIGEATWSVNGAAPDPSPSEAPELRHVWTDEYGSWYWGGVHIGTGAFAVGDPAIYAAYAMHCWLWFPADGLSPIVTLRQVSVYTTVYMSAGTPTYLPHHPVYGIGGGLATDRHWSCSRRSQANDTTHPFGRYPIGLPTDPAETTATVTVSGWSAPYNGTHVLPYYQCWQRPTGPLGMRLEHIWSDGTWSLYQSTTDIEPATDPAYATRIVHTLGTQAYYSPSTETWSPVFPIRTFSAEITPSLTVASQWPCIGLQPSSILAAGPDGVEWSAASRTLDVSDQHSIAVTRVD